jgi:ABC-type multidrug transport system fused ATPase/permease subunit
VHLTGLTSFIASLKEGFDTELDPTGKRLPKNVIFKILLIRALVHKPKLLLLEEPWQGFDEETTRQVQHLLLNETEATVIVATNDSHFIRQCDQSIALT